MLVVVDGGMMLGGGGVILNSNFDKRSLAFNEELGFRSSFGVDKRVAC